MSGDRTGGDDCEPVSRPSHLNVVEGAAEPVDARDDVKLAEVRMKIDNGYYRSPRLIDRLINRLIWELGG